MRRRDDYINAAFPLAFPSRVIASLRIRSSRNSEDLWLADTLFATLILCWNIIVLVPFCHDAFFAAAFLNLYFKENLNASVKKKRPFLVENFGRYANATIYFLANARHEARGSIGIWYTSISFIDKRCTLIEVARFKLESSKFGVYHFSMYYLQ